MGGVYGEFLASFSELFEDFKIYKQKPKVASGYDLEFSRTERGIRQSVAQTVVDKTRQRSGVMDIGDEWTLWTYNRIDSATEFVEIDGRMCRPMSSSKFNREGGFYEMTVEALVGNDGSQNENEDLEGGTF